MYRHLMLKRSRARAQWERHARDVWIEDIRRLFRVSRKSSSRQFSPGRSRVSTSHSQTAPAFGKEKTQPVCRVVATRSRRRGVEIARDSVMVMRVASPIFLCTNCPRVPSRALARAPRVASSAPPPSRVPPARSAPTDTKSLGTGPNTSPRARWTRRSSCPRRTRTRPCR